MKILLLGANGQVGWELQRSLSTFGELSIHGRNTANFEDPTALASLVQQEQPNIIVNAAAHTAVDQAETDVERAYQINTESVAVLAQEAKTLNACLIHFSTDYVFDGTKQGRYREDDETNPQSVYGQSKRDGELAILASGCKHFIVRTSWVYASRGNNFAKTMIKLASERDELKVVADQVGAPTSAELIADITSQLIYRLKQQPVLAEQASGIYHLTAAGETSWHGFAKHVISYAERLGKQFNIATEDIAPITTEQFPRPAKRPLNSRLDIQKLQSLLNIEIPDWQFHVDRMVTEFLESNEA